MALETVDFQMSLFTGLTKKEQEDTLHESLTDVRRWKVVLADMVNAWKSGDAKGLDEFLVKEMRAYPDLHKKMLLDRNQRWVSQIEQLLAGKEDVFVVVGAAHLVGSGSVVELLQKKGFRAEQL